VYAYLYASPPDAQPRAVIKRPSRLSVDVVAVSNLRIAWLTAGWLTLNTRAALLVLPAFSINFITPI